MMKKCYYRDGFTMVEVALVLAIGGLIFLMVFFALPTLNKSQRDAERRDDVIALISAIKKYQTNNRGVLPSTSDDLKDGYLSGSFEDPEGADYVLQVLTCQSTVGNANCTNDEISDLDAVNFPNYYQMFIVKGASCDGSKVVSSNNPRNFAVTYRLESGAYCDHS